MKLPRLTWPTEEINDKRVLWLCGCLSVRATLEVIQITAFNSSANVTPFPFEWSDWTKFISNACECEYDFESEFDLSDKRKFVLTKLQVESKHNLNGIDGISFRVWQGAVVPVVNRFCDGKTTINRHLSDPFSFNRHVSLYSCLSLSTSSLVKPILDFPFELEIVRRIIKVVRFVFGRNE